MYLPEEYLIIPWDRVARLILFICATENLGSPRSVGQGLGTHRCCVQHFSQVAGKAGLKKLQMMYLTMWMSLRVI